MRRYHIPRRLVLLRRFRHRRRRRRGRDGVCGGMSVTVLSYVDDGRGSGADVTVRYGHIPVMFGRELTELCFRDLSFVHLSGLYRVLLVCERGQCMQALSFEKRPFCVSYGTSY